MRRSLGSVYGGSVTRFLGPGLRGVAGRVIDTPTIAAAVNGHLTCMPMTVSRDGSTILVSNVTTHSIHEYGVADGCLRRVIGKNGRGALQFHQPGQVCFAPDDYVFVADAGNNRVQVLTPQLEFYSFLGIGTLTSPTWVCASAEVVVVAGTQAVARHVWYDLNYLPALAPPARDRDRDITVTVIRRRNGDVVHQFRSGCGTLVGLSLTQLGKGLNIVIADKRHVAVFGLDGTKSRELCGGMVSHATGMACAASGEVIVADANDRIVVFSATGELLHTFACKSHGIAVHGHTIFALDANSKQCVVVK
jgi:hypothetical protein